MGYRVLVGRLFYIRSCAHQFQRFVLSIFAQSNPGGDCLDLEISLTGPGSDFTRFSLVEIFPQRDKNTTISLFFSFIRAQ